MGRLDCLIRPLFLCPKGDLLIQVILYSQLFSTHWYICLYFLCDYIYSKGELGCCKKIYMVCDLCWNVIWSVISIRMLLYLDYHLCQNVFLDCDLLQYYSIETVD
jgi:hypothetical protein